MTITTTSNAFLSAAAGATQVGPPYPLVAAVAGKRLSLGIATMVKLTCAPGGTIAYRFSDASGAIAVSGSDTNITLSTTSNDLQVPAGKPFLEYIRVGGADVPFTCALIR